MALAAAPASARPPRRLLLAAPVVTGLALFSADYPVHAWALELIALLPLLWALTRAPSWRWAALIGALTGLSYTGPLAVVLAFPPLMGAGLAAALSLLWLLAGVLAWRVSRWPGVLGALAMAAAIVLVEWLSYTAIPVWGTAQCFARVWSAAPGALALLRWTGISGLVFVLVASQALALRVASARGRARRAPALALAVVLALPALAVALRRAGAPPRQTLRVATVGWTFASLDATTGRSAPSILGLVLPRAAEDAAAGGARLLVSPEVGLFVDRGQRDAAVQALGALATRHTLALAIGVFDVASNDNRLWFFAPDGRLVAEYVKHHLIPLVEGYRAGSGARVRFDLAGVHIGGMICQDDNFVDLARGYGRDGASLVVVPTNDWREVAPYHLENARLRGIENGYALVRAASNGISLIADAGGNVLARADHFRVGTRVLIADVPIGAAGTLYSHVGDWLAALAVLLLLVGAGLEWWARRGSAVPGHAG
ncbi:MAG: hypothetical protein IT370_32090 [Deltaproteobacteria bacterium]|nr:hypothetical protein [Deltaproteobacteria bacterium]